MENEIKIKKKKLLLLSWSEVWICVVGYEILEEEWERGY